MQRRKPIVLVTRRNAIPNRAPLTRTANHSGRGPACVCPTRDLALAALANERIFPANQAGESLGPAITWLDTLVRTTSAAIDREQRRLLVLATHAITDLREARDIAFGSHYHQQAAQLAEVIDLINNLWC